MTVWKTIKGFEKYEVSDNGCVRNANSKRILTQKIRKDGYASVGLYRSNGIREHNSVHRLVALTFIDNPECKHQVNHIDGVKLNNNVRNLEWCTPKENTEHAYRTRLRKPSDHNKCKKLGKTSKFHYVEEVKSCGEHYFRTVVKIDSAMKGKFTRSRQFSVKKYGARDAERRAALAANELIVTCKEFEGLALNVL